MDKVTFITLVTLVCYVDGKRTEIPPGQPVPESLSDLERDELLASGSIERADAADIARRQEQLAGREAQAEFEAQRQRLQESRALNEAAAASAKGDDTAAGAGGNDTLTGGAATGKGAPPKGTAKK